MFQTAPPRATSISFSQGNARKRLAVSKRQQLQTARKLKSCPITYRLTTRMHRQLSLQERPAWREKKRQASRMACLQTTVASNQKKETSLAAPTPPGLAIPMLAIASVKSRLSIDVSKSRTRQARKQTASRKEHSGGNLKCPPQKGGRMMGKTPLAALKLHARLRNTHVGKCLSYQKPPFS